MKTINTTDNLDLDFAATYESVAEALEARPELFASYDQRDVKRKARLADEGTTKAFVTNDNRVLYLYTAPDGVTLLNEFDMITVLSNGPLFPAYVGEYGVTINRAKKMKKCKENRRIFAEYDMIVTGISF